MPSPLVRVLLLCVSLGLAAGCSPATDRPDAPATDATAVPPAPAIEAVTFDPANRPYELAGPLVPATASMVSAWDIPKNPLTDPTLDDSPESEQVRRGFRLFVNTPIETPRLTSSGMSCGNCHLNAGQREQSLPLVGAAGMFPEYNNRAGIPFTLEDRIVGCFMRSEDATAHRSEQASDGSRDLPDATSPEVIALASYVRWLSDGYVPGENPPWRKQNRIEKEHLIPVDRLDTVRGEALYTEHCVQCHAADGTGVQIADKKAGPLWGPGSWNDGAGAARTYTLAGMIRFMMPYLNPGILTDEEAQHIAAYITSQFRPEYPYKDQDYLIETIPVDAVYYGDRAGRLDK